MAQWNGAEYGILRKTPAKGNHEDLLVFGYACKLFRDDEKALYIDQGKHLIPWMGDEKLKIDRYDCRGALSDLTKYESSREGFDVMRWLGLSDRERNLEEMCDKERYYSLEINEEEEEMYQEEAKKRQNTTAIQYSYDVPQNPSTKDDIPTVPAADEVDEEYIPPPILDVPVDIEIPKTVKENARIEKTALFVCRQGPQMEILIKAKQAENPQFRFLNQGDALYKFYRHVLSAFKNGRYQGYEPKNVMTTDEVDDAQNPGSGSHYLHPSLLSTNQPPEQPSTAVTIPQIPYKPSVNCSYSQLVNLIQGNQGESQEAAKPAMTGQDFSQLTYEQQQYYQYYYAQQYYEYYKEMALHQQGQGANPGQFQPPPDFQNLDPNLQNYIQQLAYSQYVHQQQANNNSYAQIVSNVNKDTVFVPQPQQNVPPIEVNITKSAVIYGPHTQEEEATEEQRKVTVCKEPAEAKTVIGKPLLSLTAYGSGSESETEDSSSEEDDVKKEVYKVPTGEAQIVIDKMAVYVSKNGEQFEDIVKAKADERFDFLNDDHEFNKYYREKIRELKGEKKEVTLKKKDEVVKKEDDVDKERDVKEAKPVKKEKKVIAPVSFSIKKAKEEQPKEIKSALPIEESDEEELENNTPPLTPNPNSLVAVLLKYTENQICEQTSKEDVTVRAPTPVRKDTPKKAIDIFANDEPVASESSDKKNGMLEEDDPILEMIDLSDDTEEKKYAKRAEDKIKDKIAAAAREKLALVTKDRALQLERKKKAAAFLKLKSVQTGNDEKPPSEKSKPAAAPVQDFIEIIDITGETSPEKPTVSDIIKSKERKAKRRKSKDRNRSKDREKKKYKSRSRDREKRKEKSESKERSSSIEREKNELIERIRILEAIEQEKARIKERNKEKKQSKREYVEDGEEEGGEQDRKKKKKKKSHKRKRSKSSRESKSKKKSKKRHRKSDADTSDSSDSS